MGSVFRNFSREVLYVLYVKEIYYYIRKAYDSVFAALLIVFAEHDLHSVRIK